MQKFMVGGAVRDKLMGLEPKDVDFVVVGSTPQEMLAAGFQQVGADFPVFLDAEGLEHALARTERKSGHGYNGFVTDFNPGKLNPELLNKFIMAGYYADKEYDIKLLLEVFRRINL